MMDRGMERSMWWTPQTSTGHARSGSATLGEVWEAGPDHRRPHSCLPYRGVMQKKAREEEKHSQLAQPPTPCCAGNQKRQSLWEAPLCRALLTGA